MYFINIFILFYFLFYIYFILFYLQTFFFNSFSLLPIATLDRKCVLTAACVCLSAGGMS